MSTEIVAEHLVALSRWVEAGNAHRDPEALTLHRVIKVAEEVGETVTALIGALGANPRKGVEGTMENVLEELLDVAVAALGAYEHIDAHQGRAYDELASKIIRVAERAGVVDPTVETWEYGFADRAESAEAEVRAREADYERRSIEGRTDQDYEQRIAALTPTPQPIDRRNAKVGEIWIVDMQGRTNIVCEVRASDHFTAGIGFQPIYDNLAGPGVGAPVIDAARRIWPEHGHVGAEL
ncbi:MazG-like family protein [Microbacterium dauci]|uniref:MazG-like family protein n=1 Tax=Microbacterium dauci TaxID=3048008 RepID=A0ABT6ZAM4_9MICO|nr:MazG-like family protein [Microbacterium sp. LX3-4]MDJ1113216.1 MazG-like family protein [Microbacterium sp. LX3-4]